jgi:ribosomal protein L30/L7E|tara:strand:+ start:1460 stop:1750 length:291 start_codon:yes stop_codon:yes gene_type:complete
MKMAATTKKKVNKVVKGLKKASKLHAKQAKTLSTLKLNKGGSTVNQAGNYTKPGMRKRMFSAIKAGSKGGNPGQWSARKAQLLASRYKKAGGGYKS